MSYLLTFCAGLLTAFVGLMLYELYQLREMAREIKAMDSTLDRMKGIVPPRPKEQQPDPSWRVVK